ncbi:MAG: hypothetical protein ACSHXF_05145 [Aquaticitalea sp.]
MKSLKITLLVALFLSVSSQTNKQPTDDSVTTHETKTHYDLMAHNRNKVQIPTQG